MAALYIVKRLTLDQFLEETLPKGKENVPSATTALILIVARLPDPSSALYLAEQWYSKTALPELLGVPAVAMDDSRLRRFWISCCPTSRPWNVISKNGRGDSLDSGPICCSLM